MRSFVVVGMGFGDEGKGSVVDWLTREEGASLVVRFNGGAQAAHHVVCPDGREHTFNQFGSGTFAGASTFLSKDVFINPLALATEAAALKDLGIDEPFRRVYVHAEAPVTTPYHVALNRLRELSRGDGRHGSCGMGIAETMLDFKAGRVIKFGDLEAGNLWRWKLRDLAKEKLATAQMECPRPEEPTQAWWDAYEILRRGARSGAGDVEETFSIVANNVRLIQDYSFPLAKPVIFEGAQGILLDQDWGFAPYHTWSRTHSENARRIIADKGETTILGVTRAYLTRHGRGPFPTEDATVAEPDTTNPTNNWQEDFRLGWPDLALLRYAAKVDGNLDGLVVTCMDKLKHPVTLYSEDYIDLPDGEVPSPSDDTTHLMMQAEPYYRWTPSEELPQLLASAAGVPLYAVSYGRTALEKHSVTLSA